MILHIIDNATRFSIAAVVRWKWKEEIVDAFIKHYIAIFGAPSMVFSDNADEINNSLFLNMAEQLNISSRILMVKWHGCILAKSTEKLILNSDNWCYIA